jgi:FixJ family two-component response regulator
MPGRSGHELALELRGDQPILPIVLLSGHDDLSAALPAVPGTSIVMLQKPPAFDELLRVVRAELDAG